MAERRMWLLSDPHLGRDMSIFGPAWTNHEQRMADAWDRLVGPRDVVLVPGDLSWARNPREAAPHLAWLAARPGARIVLARGNHDWWWRSRAKIADLLPPRVTAVDGSAERLPEGVIVLGAKGYTAPNDPEFEEQDDRGPYERNLARTRDALAAATPLAAAEPELPVVLCLHYPPFTSNGKPTAYLDLIRKAPFRIDHCVYGHYHRPEEQALIPHGELVDTTRHWIGSADFLRMTPIQIHPHATLSP